MDQSEDIVGYYSVRRKPNQKALDIIKAIYEKLLNLEKNGGIDASFKYLQNLLNEKNTTYDEFVNNLQRS